MAHDLQPINSDAISLLIRNVVLARELTSFIALMCLFPGCGDTFWVGVQSQLIVHAQNCIWTSLTTMHKQMCMIRVARLDTCSALTVSARRSLLVQITSPTLTESGETLFDLPLEPSGIRM